MPSWFKTTEWGRCRWCNLPILKDDGTINKRRRWHPDCIHDYLIITDHRYAKRQVKKRDKGVCAHCGKKCRYRWEWDCDHIVPLRDIPSRDLKYWMLDALETLCRDCHHAKSLKENIKRGSGWFSRHKKKPMK